MAKKDENVLDRMVDYSLADERIQDVLHAFTYFSGRAHERVKDS